VEQPYALAHYINAGVAPNCSYVKVQTGEGIQLVVVALVSLPPGAELYVDYDFCDIEKQERLSTLLSYIFPPESEQESVKLLAYGKGAGGKRKRKFTDSQQWIMGGRWVEWPSRAGATILSTVFTTSPDDVEYFLKKEKFPGYSQFFVLDRTGRKVTRVDKGRNNLPLIPHFNLFAEKPDLTQVAEARMVARFLWDRVTDPQQICDFLHGPRCDIQECRGVKSGGVRKDLMRTSKDEHKPGKFGGKAPRGHHDEEILCPEEEELWNEVGDVVYGKEEKTSPTTEEIEKKLFAQFGDSKHYVSEEDEAPVGEETEIEVSSEEEREKKRRLVGKPSLPPKPASPTSPVRMLRQVDWDFGQDGKQSSLRPLNIYFQHPECLPNQCCPGWRKKPGFEEQLKNMIELLPPALRNQWVHTCMHFLCDVQKNKE
jgi:hypothetical protein